MIGRLLHLAILTAFLAVPAWPVAGGTFDMDQMIERIASLTGLPGTAEPRAVREVSMTEVIRRTGKAYARASYYQGSREIVYAPEYKWLVPHEVTHMLQIDDGRDPLTDENEAQAAWVQLIYWRLYPPEAATKP